MACDGWFQLLSSFIDQPRRVQLTLRIGHLDVNLLYKSNLRAAPSSLGQGRKGKEVGGAYVSGFGSSGT